MLKHSFGYNFPLTVNPFLLNGMSRGNGDAENQLQYYDYRYVITPQAQAALNDHLIFTNDNNYTQMKNETQPDTKTIEALSDQASTSQPYNQYIGSIHAIDTSQGPSMPLDKQVMDTTSYYSEPIHPLATVHGIDMVQQQPMYGPTPQSGYYGLDYVQSDYYPEPFRAPQDATAHPYFLENTVITKETIRLSPIKFCSNCFTTETPSWRRCTEGKNLLCNACGLYEKLHHTPRKICLHPDGSTKIVRHNTSENEGCAMCGITYSSLWRKLDRKCYCNSCAIRFGIGHSKRMSLPQVWSDSVASERDNADRYQNTGGLLFSSLTPHPQRDM